MLTSNTLFRCLAVWLLILLLASLNGALRDLLLAPRMGDTAARALSTLMLAAIIVLVTRAFIGWMAPRSSRAAFAIGVLWLVLTLAFEFLAGHYLFHKPWAVLLEDYDLLRLRIWPLALLATLLAPWWAWRRTRPSLPSHPPRGNR